MSGARDPGVASLGRRCVVTALILLLGVGLTAGADHLLQERAEERSRAESEQVVSTTAASIQRGFDLSAEVDQSIANLFMSAPGIGPKDFAAFVDGTLVNHTEFESVAYLQWVPESQRPAVESALSRLGHGSGILEPAPTGGLTPADRRDGYVVVLFARPAASMAGSVGLDAFAMPALAPVISRVRDTDGLGVVPSNALAPAAPRSTVLLLRAVYDPSMPRTTPEQRRAAFRGMAAATLSVPSLIRSRASAVPGGFDFSLVETSPVGAGAAFAWVDGRLEEQDEARRSIARLGPAQGSAPVRVGDREFELSAHPASPAAPEQPTRDLVLGLGLVVTLLSAVLYWRWSRGRRLERLARALSDANRQLADGAGELRRLAEEDRLTALPNRSSMQRQVEERVDGHHDEPVTLALVDLDRFKVVNDSVGHRQGDDLLCAVAARIVASVDEGVVVGRMAGDEFGVLIRGAGPHEGAEQVERVLGALGRPFRVGDRVVHLTASAGSCSFPADVDDASELMVNAGVALHAAKEGARGRWMAYDRAIAERAERREWIERDLRRTLDLPDGSLSMNFQPKVDLRSGEIVGAEALARWTHPEHGPVGPNEFIPVAEETGLIVRLGDFALRQSCDLLRQCLDRGLPLSSISVNLSAQQLRSDAFVRTLRNELDRAEVPATMVMLEVTETIAMDVEEDDGATVRRLGLLREFGVRLSIDDFGTGYSSMSRIAELPVHEVKIDRAFVSALPEGQAQAGITKAIIAMAHHLGLVVVAEGVETTDQLAWLRSEGCDEAQGWLFGRAVPAEVFVAMLHPGHPDRDEAGVSSSGRPARP